MQGGGGKSSREEAWAAATFTALHVGTLTGLLTLHTSRAQWQAVLLLKTSACESAGVLLNMQIPELSTLRELQCPQVEPKNLITLFKQFLFHKRI